MSSFVGRFMFSPPKRAGYRWFGMISCCSIFLISVSNLKSAPYAFMSQFGPWRIVTKALRSLISLFGRRVYGASCVEYSFLPTRGNRYTPYCWWYFLVGSSHSLWEISLTWTVALNIFDIKTRCSWHKNSSACLKPVQCEMKSAKNGIWFRIGR